MTIFLDLDGTLLDHDAAERSAAAAFLASFCADFPTWSPTDFVDLWQRLAQKHIDSYLVGKFSFIEQRRARLRELFGMIGVSLSDRAADERFGIYKAHYETSWRPFPDVIETLDRLQGHVLGIISNGDKDQQERKIASLGIGDRFAHVVISDEVGSAKPDVAIFLEACRRAGCSPEQSFYVGDRLETDARGSRRAGLHGVWLDRSGSRLAIDDVGVISSLLELPEYLERMIETSASQTLDRDGAPRAETRNTHGPRVSQLVAKE